MVRASSPGDLLSLIPYLLGFQPEESLVMLAFAGKRVVFTARVDLPVPAKPFEHGTAELVAEHFAGLARHHGADGVLLAAFTRHEAEGAAVLGVAQEVCGGLLLSAWVSDGQTFCEVHHGLAGPAEPYDPQTSSAVATAVYEGMTVLPSRDDVAASAAADPPERRTRVKELLGRFPARQMTEAQERLDELVDGYAELRLLSEDEIAELLVLCRDLAVRDRAWTVMSRDNADVALDFWGQVARAAPLDDSAPAVSLMGMAAWVSGNGALMLCCADRVAVEHPRYSMGQLLMDLAVSSVHPKEWEEIRHHLTDDDHGVDHSAA